MLEYSDWGTIDFGPAAFLNACDLARAASVRENVSYIIQVNNAILVLDKNDCGDVSLTIAFVFHLLN